MADTCSTAAIGPAGVASSSRRSRQPGGFATTPRCFLPPGGHEIWWTVDAGGQADAARLLPFFYVAQRTTVAYVSEVQIP